MAKKTNFDLSIEYQQKFDFYFLGLVFTLLSLAIQSSKIVIGTWNGVIECLGLGLLFLSGLAGLFRISDLSLMYNTEHVKQINEKELNVFNTALSQGVSVLYDHKTDIEPREEVVAEEKKRLQTI